jgi:hypothetical protein
MLTATAHDRQYRICLWLLLTARELGLLTCLLQVQCHYSYIYVTLRSRQEAQVTRVSPLLAGEIQTGAAYG